MQPNSPDTPDTDSTIDPLGPVDVHAITPDVLAALGLGQIAYIRNGVTPDGVKAVEIHAANGDVLGYAQSENLARAIALQNDLDAFSVH